MHNLTSHSKTFPEERIKTMQWRFHTKFWAPTTCKDKSKFHFPTHFNFFCALYSIHLVCHLFPTRASCFPRSWFQHHPIGFSLLPSYHIRLFCFAFEPALPCIHKFFIFMDGTKLGNRKSRQSVTLQKCHHISQVKLFAESSTYDTADHGTLSTQVRHAVRVWVQQK